MAITNTTKLEAINVMLSAVGSSPISTLTGQLTADSIVAQNILDEVTREVCSQGWAFNSETKVEIQPQADKTVSLGNDVARIDSTPDYNTDVDIVQRGLKLYDRKNHTNLFDDTLTCDVIYYLEYTELPEAARRFIMIRSARVFQDRMVGSPNHHTYNLNDEMSALVALKEHEGDTGDHSIFNSWATRRVINRPSALDGMSF